MHPVDQRRPRPTTARAARAAAARPGAARRAPAASRAGRRAGCAARRGARAGSARTALQEGRELVLGQDPAGSRGPAPAALRSGKKRSFSETVRLAVQRRQLAVAGYSRSGTLAWPRARSSTNSLSASTARSMTPSRGRRRPRPVAGREAGLDRLAEPRRARQPHDAQRAAHLVQLVGARRAGPRCLRRGRRLRDRSRTSVSARSTSALIQTRSGAVVSGHAFVRRA